MTSDPYALLASEIAAQPSVLSELKDWFDSNKPLSAFYFGNALGKDAAANVGPIVSGWIANGKCQPFAGGYLNGLATAFGNLPQPWTNLLDEISSNYPKYAAELTLQADFNDGGVKRLLKLITKQAIPPGFLRGLSAPPWISIVSAPMKSNILHSILFFLPADPEGMINTGLSLISDWTNRGELELPTHLVVPCEELLQKSLEVRVEPHNWAVLLKVLLVKSSSNVADAALQAISSLSPSSASLEEESLQVLIDLAKAHPRLVMERVGQKLMETKARAILAIHPLTGLLETIGVSEVKKWVQENGESYVEHIARHVDSPYVDGDRPIIPSVTEWLLVEYESDDEVFESFCWGRHTGEVRVGHAHDRRAVLEAMLHPFILHPIPRVRDWAKFELKKNQNDAESDDYFDDIRKRT